MNARFNMNTPEEAAKSIGVCTHVVTAWCRDKKINCTNISDGTHKGRYEITDAEVNYIRKLVHQYGARNLFMYYKKDWSDTSKIKGTSSSMTVIEDHIVLVNKDTKELPSEGYVMSSAAAKYIGVDNSLLNRLCKYEKINCINSKNEHGPGDIHKIPVWEVKYLKELYEKYGKNPKNGAMSHYVKERGMTMNVVPDEYEVTKTPIEEKYENMDIVKHDENDKINIDKISNTILYIQQVKERIEDCKTELAQLENEYAELKQEVIDSL